MPARIFHCEHFGDHFPAAELRGRPVWPDTGGQGAR